MGITSGLGVAGGPSIGTTSKPAGEGIIMP
jgi:hypothetical protein